MARRPKRWREVVAGSGEEDLSAMARLMKVMVEMVSSARPPSVSATKGTKSVPEERQAERLEASLRCAREGEPMRSFSRRIAGFTLVRYVYTWARAVEMAAVLVRRVHLRSYARFRTRRTMAKASH